MSRMVQALFYSLNIHYTKPIQDLVFKELIISLSANEADVIKKKKKKTRKKCAVSFIQRKQGRKKKCYGTATKWKTCCYKRGYVSSIQ